MLEQPKIDRINALARKSRTEGLTCEEKEEQAALRGEYLAALRVCVHSMLENVSIAEPDGSVTPLKRKEDEKH